MMLDGTAPNIAIISSVIGYLLGNDDRSVFASSDLAIIASIEHDSLLYKQLGKSSPCLLELFTQRKVSICVAFLSRGVAADLAIYDSGNSETVKPIAKMIYLRLVPTHRGFDGLKFNGGLGGP